MFSLNQGPENVPAIEGQTPHDKRFLDAVDAAMTARLGCGLDRPDRYRLWVPVPNGTVSKKISGHREN